MTVRSLLLCLGLALFSACADFDTESTEPERHAIGKADVFGSCEFGSCGGQSNTGNCYCDDECVDYDDCCPDKAEVCDGDGELFCGGIANLGCPGGMTCQVDGASADAGGHCVIAD